MSKNNVKQTPKRKLEAERMAKNKDLMIERLQKRMGIVTHAAKDVGITVQTHYNWMNKDPDYRQRVLGAKDYLLDFAEAHLLKLIEQGDTKATIFLLETLGKERGYTKRSELTGMNGKDIIPAEMFKDKTDEDLDRELKELEKYDAE